MRSTLAAGILAALMAVLLLPALGFAEEMEEMKEMESSEMMMPFGGGEDVAFAGALWTAMEGYHDWIMKSDVMPGASPHGMFVRLYYNIVTIGGMAYHVVVKDNFGGEGATLEMVTENPGEYLMAVTPMVQREAGYDPDNNDWFWVKYNADGSVGMNDKGMAMAGRVAKGMPMGCIACHAKAADGDYLFTND